MIVRSIGNPDGARCSARNALTHHQPTASNTIVNAICATIAVRLSLTESLVIRADTPLSADASTFAARSAGARPHRTNATTAIATANATTRMSGVSTILKLGDIDVNCETSAASMNRAMP